VPIALERQLRPAKNWLNFQPEQPITEAGLRNNINVGIHYLGSWLAGNGCVPIHNLMEDAATAEISRSQVWQWVFRRRACSTMAARSPWRWFAR
jgi:malate synthase